MPPNTVGYPLTQNRLGGETSVISAEDSVAHTLQRKSHLYDKQTTLIDDSAMQIAASFNTKTVDANSIPSPRTDEKPIAGQQVFASIFDSSG